jgi:hypothetical protein
MRETKVFWTYGRGDGEGEDLGGYRRVIVVVSVGLCKVQVQGNSGVLASAEGIVALQEQAIALRHHDVVIRQRCGVVR